jgi:hypothetical protein
MVLNWLTALSYLLIGTLVATSCRGLLPMRYQLPFAFFIFACGLHHAVHHAFCDPRWTFIVDSTMTGISVATAALILTDPTLRAEDTER